MREIDQNLSVLRRRLNKYFREGNPEDLAEVVANVAASESHKMTESVLFELSDRSGSFEGNVERVIEFYSAHPSITRVFFGEILALKMDNDIPLSASDLLTGGFQSLVWEDYSEPGEVNEPRAGDWSVERLQSCEDWALLRLEEWLANDGRERVDNLSRRLCGYDAEIRQHPAWMEFIRTALAWLGDRWLDEIGRTPWISESQLFELVKSLFVGFRVDRHAMPSWLAPQHLDIFLPELKIGIEYMGVQHFEPVAVFGGEEGFARTTERDRRKSEKCAAAGVRLEYVRHNEDLAYRAREIRALVPS